MFSFLKKCKRVAFSVLTGKKMTMKKRTKQDIYTLYSKSNRKEFGLCLQFLKKKK